MFKDLALAQESIYKDYWEDPKPSPYPGRYYTHNQYVRIFLNDGVLYKNQAIYGDDMPVFCLPGQLTSGYTAAEIRKLRNDPFTYGILKSTGNYTGTGGNVEYFLIHNYIGKTDYISTTTSDTNVIVQNSNSSVPVLGTLNKGPDNATSKDPYLITNDNPFSVAWVGSKDPNYGGFYYATTYLSGDKGGQVGSTKLTFDAAKSLVTHKDNIQVNTDMYISYNYNLILSNLRSTKLAKNPGEKESWAVHVLNQTPFVAVKDKTHLRAFIQEEGSEPQLVNSTDVELNKQSFFMWDFNYSLPENDFDLIVTVNKNYINGKWTNDPLVTAVSEEPSIKPYGEKGTMELTYEDNIITQTLTGGYYGGNGNSGGSGTPNDEEPPIIEGPDLAAMDLTLYDNSGNRMADSLEEGKNYTVTAVFKNNYDKGGFASLRLYAKQKAGNYQLRNDKFVFLEPGATVYVKKSDDWIFIGSDGATPAVTINYFWSGDNWKGGQFKLDSGEQITETDYSNNIYEKSYSVSKDTTPQEEGFHASYFPMMEVKEPIYETITEKVWQPEVKKVPYKSVEFNPKVRAKLVPIQKVSRSSSEERPGWYTLVDGSRVYGYWAFPKGYPKILVECDKSGNKTGFAYMNDGKFVEQQREVLIGYETKYVEDHSQPKRYLYPASVFPSIRYMGERLDISSSGPSEPKEIHYPFGDYLNREEWRQIVVPVTNPNDWSVTAKVTTFIPERREIFVTIEARETKYVLVELPKNEKVNGYNPYEFSRLTVVTHIEQNHDPYAPDKYKYQPMADDGQHRVFYYCDATGIEFGNPEWYEGKDKYQRVYALVPAFKEEMEWVPDDPYDPVIGHPEYKTVPGYAWDTVTVYRPEAKDFNIKHIGTSHKLIDRDEKLYKRTKTYSVCQGFENTSQFNMKCSDLQVCYRDTKADSRYKRLPEYWDLTLASGESKYVSGEVKYESEVRKYGKRSWITIDDDSFNPSILSGNLTDGATVDTITGYGDVSINAVAGVDNYCDEDKWRNEFEPYVNLNIFDYCEVMTVSELLAFGNHSDERQLDRNLEYFVKGQPDSMCSSAEINIYKTLKRWRD